MPRSTVRECLLLVVCCFLLVAGQRPVLAQPLATTTVVTFYACVDNSSGAIRIVSKTDVCKTTEHKISWNQLRPKGLAGTLGPQGPQGPQGPPGISVGYSGVLPFGTFHCRAVKSIGLERVDLRSRSTQMHSFRAVVKRTDCLDGPWRSTCQG
jgi:hypothetical protein